jgi:hypothetical protein
MSEPFGPFRLDADIDNKERVAQFRCLRTLVHVHFHLSDLERLLWEAESSKECAQRALAMLDTVPSLYRRKILASFAYLHRPAYIGRCKGTTRGSSDDEALADRNA